MLGGEVGQHGPEERQRDAHAAEDEVFPSGLDRFGCAVERDQQDSRQGRALDRDPEHAQIVGGERQQHGEHEGLVHAVIDPYAAEVDASLGTDMAHIGPREDGGGETHERGQDDEIDIEGIHAKADPDQPARDLALQRNQPGQPSGRGQGQRRDREVQPAARDGRPDQCKQERAEQRRKQGEQKCGHGRSSTATSAVSLRRLSRSTSSESMLSRI